MIVLVNIFVTINGNKKIIFLYLEINYFKVIILILYI